MLYDYAYLGHQVLDIEHNEYFPLFSAPEKIKSMSQVLSTAREQLYDCGIVTKKR